MTRRVGISCLLALCLAVAVHAVAYAQETNEALKARADSLHAEVFVYYNAGRYNEATTIAREVLAIRERVLGPDHPDVGSSLNNLGLLLQQQGDFAEARPLLERALAIDEAALSPDHPSLATSLNSLAMLLQELGDFVAAEPLFERALSIRERVLGPSHPDVAGSLNNLAGLLKNKGDYEAARPMLERALVIWEQAHGPDHPVVATGLGNLAELHQSQGDFTSARPLFERALAIMEQALDPGHPDRAKSMNNLARLLHVQGDYEAARPLYERALVIWEQAFGSDHPAVALSLNNLAGLLENQGDYAAARPLLERALAIWEKTFGPDHFDVATSLNNLAGVLQAQGDYEAAKPLYERALSIREQVLGPDHPLVALNLSNLAGLLQTQGDYLAALPLYERVVGIWEKTYGPAHPFVAKSFNNLALLFEELGDYETAKPMYELALAIREKVFSEDHPDVAGSLNNLAALLEDMEEYDEAFALTDRAISIFDKTLAQPDLRILAYQQRARLHKRAGRDEEAFHDLDEALRAADERRPQIGGDEETRAAFFQQYAHAFDGMVHWQIEDGNLAQAFDYAERGRARVFLDQLAAGKVDIRASIPADIRAPLETRETRARARMAELQQRLTLLRARDDLTPFALARDLSALQDSLSRAARAYQQVYAEIKNASPLWRDQITTGGRPVDLATVQRRLVPDQGLMLIYQLGSEQSYLFVISPGRRPVEALPLMLTEKAAAMFDLEAGPLTTEAVALMLRGSDKDGGGVMRQLGVRDSKREGGSLEEALYVLWQVLIPEAITARLVASQEVVIVPDGALFYLPFEALVMERAAPGRVVRYWLDAGPVVRYAPSATVLATISQRPAARVVPLANAARVLSLSDAIFNPAEGDAREGVQEAAASRGTAALVQPVTRDSYERAGGVLKRLPGTAEETAAIAVAYGQEASQALERLQQLEAREPRVREALAEKRYLHLATHGLVNERQGSFFASLALTPPPGETARPDDDGFLQLHEIYTLTLPDVELAVLSACATNIGASVEGEGVFALSRGFLVAGARRVIASQWSVDDASTAALMRSLFEQIVAWERSGQEMDYARALREARRAVRRQASWSDPYYWAPFILTGKQ